MARKKKAQSPPVEISAEPESVVRGTATLSARVARHLLRRTRLLTHQAAHKLPVVAALDATATEGHITIVLPETEPYQDEQGRREEELARALAEAQARAERAEQAAAWLRARLRAERARHRAASRLDMDALGADLARELARLPAPQRPDDVQRVVQRTLDAHGLAPAPTERPAARVPADMPAARVPADMPATRTPAGWSATRVHAEKRGAGPGAADGQGAAHVPGDDKRAGGDAPADALPWSQEQQELLARQVLARAPEVADPAYVYRALALLARRRLTLAELVQAGGLTSAMSRRRLRLAVEALAALGALTARDDAYTLNAAWAPAQRRTSPRRRGRLSQREQGRPPGF